MAQLQEPASDSPEVSAISLYRKSRGEQSGIYKGVEYMPFPFRISNGHVFFESADWQKSRIDYDGETYDQVDALYDLLNDQLLVRYFNNFSTIQLYRERVKSFTLLGHTFILMSADSAVNALSPGFYDQLYKGKISLLAKRSKQIREIITDVIIREVSQKNRYYILKDNHYYSISSKKDIQKLLDNDDIRQFVKKNKSLFRNNIEEAFLSTVKFYDSTYH